VSILATVFYRQRVKVEDVEQHMLVGCGRFFHVDPDDIGFIRQQIRELLDGETFFDAIGIVPIKKNFHHLSFDLEFHLLKIEP
jgi:hypothetical protein